MAEISSDPTSARVVLFNSPLETGLRAVFILDAAYPQAIDLANLTWLDYLIVHTGDIGGPESLHPDIPGRNGELLVRRRLLEDSLTLMRRLHLIDVIASADGIEYRSSDEVPALIELMQSPYALALKDRAKWLVATVGTRDLASAVKRRNPRIDDWHITFTDDSQLPGGTP